MNKGVEILLERMTSNPDEFLPSLQGSSYPAKWADTISAVYARKHRREGHAPFYDLSFLSDEDVDALFDKLQEIRGDHFTKRVMATLLTDDSSEEETESITYKSAIPHATGIAVATGSTTLTLGKSQLTEKKMRELDEMLEAYEIAKEKEKLEQMKKQAKELTKTQKRIAEKLYVSYDDYAKKVSEIEASE